MEYKKGQIVPRRLVRCKNRRIQHAIKFGEDVKVDGRTITVLGVGPAIYIAWGRTKSRGKTLPIKDITVENVMVVVSKLFPSAEKTENSITKSDK